MLSLLLCLFLCFGWSGARAEGSAEEKPITYSELIQDLVRACQEPSDQALARIDSDAAAIGDGMAQSITEYWKQVWLDPDYRLYQYGEDDPAQLPVSGRHAFVVLGYQLQNGEMTEELIGRCDAAAAAALAFPESILICSGGATGKNNPKKHTEAGLMKAYLSEQCGIQADRIFIDERAMTTEENARNTLAILQKQEIETMTIVTSSYHQRRGQTLYHAMAAKIRMEQGYKVEIIGNYCYPVEKDIRALEQEVTITASQLSGILGISDR